MFFKQSNHPPPPCHPKKRAKISTPLFSVEDLDTAKLVIELGGDPRHKNSEGKTAAENLAEDYPEVCNYLRSLVGEPPLEESASQSEQEDPAESSLDPTNEMTKTLIDKVREMMTDAESNGIDTDSPELDLRLRELVTKTVDQSVDLGKLLASSGRDHSQSAAVVAQDLASVAEGEEPTEENKQAATGSDSNKRQKT
ncbi:hypothetical protein, variant [Puccinia triticina 1-1 BBBD Race 1]|uniref:ANK_REP_REGION domain-containing protein n=1 Tax=Puccinia triticina (isolate 1-1 / race 1 (BBBD)) TaxID=630390 RepID=A0A180GMB7_PUCT1|nr:hypothetical protein, variant [Puccinia triticina 1-1 BBBD Race 1]